MTGAQQTTQRDKPITPERIAELTTRLSGSSVAIRYEPDSGELRISLPAGRETRTASFRASADLEAVAALPLESLQLVGDYAAICSYSEGVIEAQIEPISQANSLFQLSALLDAIPFSDSKGKPISVTAESGITIALQPASDQFRALAPFALGFTRSMLRRGGLNVTLRLSNVRIATNDEAIALLRRIADSVFFQVDLISGIALGLTRVRAPVPGIGRPRAKRQSVAETLQFPKHEFHQEAMAYYWFARGARGASHFQFLSYYQVLEFYYATYTNNEACKRVSQILKSPTFRADRETDVARIVAATEIRQQAAERDQLKLTLTSCVSVTEFRDWLNEDELRIKALTTKEGQLISKHLISLKDPSANLIEIAALRIYDIRCRIVHTGADAPTQTSNILPYSAEAKQLKHDIEMAAFFAKAVLIANAAPIHVAPKAT